jgi:hypothetical protein
MKSNEMLNLYLQKKAVNEDLSIGNTLISALSKAEGKYKAIISDYENAIKLGDKATEFERIRFIYQVLLKIKWLQVKQV